jgi:hypothetical protein
MSLPNRLFFMLASVKKSLFFHAEIILFHAGITFFHAGSCSVKKSIFSVMEAYLTYLELSTGKDKRVIEF